MPVELVTEIVAEIYPLPPVLHWLRLSEAVSPDESLGHCLYLMPEEVENENLLSCKEEGAVIDIYILSTDLVLMVTAMITIARRPEMMEVTQIHFLLLRTLLLEETIPPVSPVSRLTLFLENVQF